MAPSPGAQYVSYLRLSTILMFVIGVIAIMGGITEFGPIAILLGLMMIVSGVIKLFALRIMNDGGRLPGGVRKDE